MDAIAAFADHVVRTRFKDLSSDAVSAAKTFITDTFGVGIGGSSGPLACELAEMQETWGRLQEARVWGNGIRLPAQAAVMCNAYQVHNSEFDCVHEEAVVHAMTIVLPVAIAGAERRKNVSGADSLPQLRSVSMSRQVWVLQQNGGYASFVRRRRVHLAA